MTITQAFDNVADMLARLDPEKVLALYAPPEVSERVEELVSKKKEGMITSEETLELERYLALDLLISMAKARASVLMAA